MSIRKQEILDMFNNILGLNDKLKIDKFNYLIKDEIDPSSSFGNNSILLGEDIACEEFIQIVRNNDVRHVVQNQQQNVDRELLFTESIITDVDAFFSDPVQVLVSDPKSSLIGVPNNIQRYPINSKPDKVGCISNLVDNLSSEIKYSDFVKESCLLIAEELMMNMLYDAPRYYKTLPAELQKDGEKTAELVVANNEKYIAFIAIDSYGSLDINRLLDRLLDCYKSSKVVLNMDTSLGGAGYGCRMIYDQSTSLVLGVKPGVCTVVSCLLPVRISQRKRQTLPKILHIVK